MASQPFVPLADGAQVELIFQLFGQNVENRLWFITRQPPITSTQLDALTAGVRDWHLAQVLPYLSQDIQLVLVLGREWTSFPTPNQTVLLPATFGGAAEPAYSANVAVRVAFKGTSDQTFPNNSNFVPGIPLSAVNGNYYTTAFRNRLFDAYVSLIDDAASFGPFPAWRWVITSRIVSKAYRTTQEWSRMDFVRFPSPVVSPRRKRLP